MRNRRNNYLWILLVVLIGVSIGYAVINTTLNINGRSSISKNTWDVHFDNVIVGGSVEAVKIPTITDNTTVDFEVALNLPGDFYEFTVDVVNNGTIDAMIESVNKTPELTEAQAKYLNYTITYENGEEIATKQLVSKESLVRLKVKVELRKDVDPADLPDVGDVLYLSFTVNYIQSDQTAIGVTNNGKVAYEVVNGDLNTVGSEICIGEECFYLMKNDGSDMFLLSKYNLYVGGINDSGVWTAYGDEVTGIQNSEMKGYVNTWIRKGTVKFAETEYWSNDYDWELILPEYGTEYPSPVYDSNSVVYNYVQNYKEYLETLGVKITNARLIQENELRELGWIIEGFFIRDCTAVPAWVYSTSYWVGVAYNRGSISAVRSDCEYGGTSYNSNLDYGVRPVIVIER